MMTLYFLAEQVPLQLKACFNSSSHTNTRRLFYDRQNESTKRSKEKATLLKWVANQ